jgi:hypothetical protein
MPPLFIGHEVFILERNRHDPCPERDDFSSNPPIQFISESSPASHSGGPGSNPGLVMWDFVIDKSGAGAGFLQKLRFSLPIYIPSASPQSSSLSPEAGTIGQEWPQCQIASQTK